MQPNKLNYVQMNTEMYTESADKQFVFLVSPRDAYGNMVDSSESEINLQIEWPETGSQYSYFAEENPKTQQIQYTLESRVAGQYLISSDLFKEKEFKFNVVPGVCDKTQSQIEVSPVILNSGDVAFASI